MPQKTTNFNKKNAKISAFYKSLKKPTNSNKKTTHYQFFTSNTNKIIPNATKREDLRAHSTTQESINQLGKVDWRQFANICILQGWRERGTPFKCFEGFEEI